MGATQTSLWMDADALARQLNISLTDLDTRLNEGTVETLEYKRRRLYRTVSEVGLSVAGGETVAANDDDSIRVLITPELASESTPTIEEGTPVVESVTEAAPLIEDERLSQNAENAWNQVITLVERYEDRIDTLLVERKTLTEDMRTMTMDVERHRSETELVRLEGKRQIDLERQTRHSAEVERDRVRSEVRTLRQDMDYTEERLRLHERLQTLPWWHVSERVAIKKRLANGPPTHRLTELS